MEILDYYKIIKTTIQLTEVELKKMYCENRGMFEGFDTTVDIKLKRKVINVSKNDAKIELDAQVGSDKTPFFFDIEYTGICESKNTEINKETLEKYAYDNIVPLLLPYVRECVSSTMARMQLPVFTIPTMDVLNSMEENIQEEKEQG